MRLTGFDRRFELLTVQPARVYVDQEVRESSHSGIKDGRPAFTAASRLCVIQILTEQPGQRAGCRGFWVNTDGAVCVSVCLYCYLCEDQ